MYIGPWQEYNLSKSRKNEKVENNEAFRNELISLLEKNLDPENALKTIQAIKPLLDKSSDSSKLPQIRRPSNFRPKPRILSQLTIEPVDNSLQSLPSHRSTRSEPIQSPKSMFPDVQTNSINTSRSDTTRRKDYDAYSMISILKQERNMRKNEEKNTAISQYWKWNTSSKQGESSTPNINSMNSVSNKMSNDKQQIKKSKVDMVNQMKIIYTSGIYENCNSIQDSTINNKLAVDTSHTLPGTTSPSHKNIQLSPISTTKKNSSSMNGVNNIGPPKTPIVHDKDLTDSDFAVISKYFKPHNKDNPTNITVSETQQIESSNSKKLLSPKTPIRVSINSYNRNNLHLPSLTSPINTQHSDGITLSGGTNSLGNGNSATSESNSYQTNNKNIDNNINMNRLNKEEINNSPFYKPSSSKCGTPGGYFDDAYGSDVLLNWSSNLNIDDVDSLY